MRSCGWIGPPGTGEPGGRIRLTAAKPAQAPAEQEQPPAGTQTTAPSQPAKDGGDDDGGGVPIWAGIGLMLMAAVAGSAAARARNRRRMRDHMPRASTREGRPGAVHLMILMDSSLPLVSEEARRAADTAA